MNIAIIPARGGSRRIKKKNIKNFAGKPLILYSIDAAKSSKLFEKIIVSTDSSEIAQVAKEANVEVPFKRPANLADEYTSTFSVIKHSINWIKNNGFSIDHFCCIYPNPFVTSENLIKAYDLLQKYDVASVIPITTFPYPTQRGVIINNEGFLEFVSLEHAMARSQDLPEVYHDTGQFYWWDYNQFIKIKNAKEQYQVQRYPFIIPRHLAQDLDTPEDWEFAKKLYACIHEKT